MPRSRSVRTGEEIRESHRHLMQRRRASTGTSLPTADSVLGETIVKRSRVQLQNRRTRTLAQIQQSTHQNSRQVRT